MFRSRVFERDRNVCVICGNTGPLDAHHITPRELMPFGGYVPENGISLCSQHHLEAESDLKNDSETPFRYYLYKLINSSYELAYTMSLRLEDE